MAGVASYGDGEVFSPDEPGYELLIDDIFSCMETAQKLATGSGRTRGMTSSQVALGCPLQKAPWIVPIPGTTKLSHIEENLRTLDFNVSPEEWKEFETAVATIPVVGDRYNAEQQKQVGFQNNSEYEKLLLVLASWIHNHFKCFGFFVFMPSFFVMAPDAVNP